MYPVAMRNMASIDPNLYHHRFMVTDKKLADLLRSWREPPVEANHHKRSPVLLFMVRTLNFRKLLPVGCQRFFHENCLFIGECTDDKIGVTVMA